MKVADEKGLIVEKSPGNVKADNMEGVETAGEQGKETQVHDVIDMKANADADADELKAQKKEMEDIVQPIIAKLTRQATGVKGNQEIAVCSFRQRHSRSTPTAFWSCPPRTRALAPRKRSPLPTTRTG